MISIWIFFLAYGWSNEIHFSNQVYVVQWCLLKWMVQWYYIECIHYLRLFVTRFRFRFLRLVCHWILVARFNFYLLVSIYLQFRCSLGMFDLFFYTCNKSKSRPWKKILWLMFVCFISNELGNLLTSPAVTIHVNGKLVNVWNHLSEFLLWGKLFG